MKLDLDNGKYTYVFEDNKQYALRYGEEWRDLSGDNLILHMGFMIEELMEEVKLLQYQKEVLVKHTNYLSEENTLINFNNMKYGKY